MRLLIATEARYDYTAGHARSQDGVNGAENWRLYDEHGFDVVLLARTYGVPAGTDVPLGDGVTVRALPYYRGLRGAVVAVVGLVWALRRAFAERDGMLVARLPGPIGSLACFLAAVARRRYAVELVGDPREVLAQGTIGPVGRLLARFAAAVTRAAVRRAGTVHYVTERVLQERYPSAPRAVSVAFSNVHLSDEDFAGEPRQLSEAAPDQPILVIVASLEQPYKGHGVALRALAILRDRGLNAQLIVIGDGRMRSDLETLTARLGLIPRVTFRGRVDNRAALREELDRADVFLLPSLSEGLPRALVEAMARGLPAVASAVGGVPELLETRRLAPPGDAVALADRLQQLLTDARAMREESVRNLSHAQRFRAAATNVAKARWLAGLGQETLCDTAQ